MDKTIDIIVIEYKDRLARLYGKRRTKRQTEKLINELNKYKE